jgi:hypothetical protein
MAWDSPSSRSEVGNTRREERESFWEKEAPPAKVRRTEPIRVDDIDVDQFDRPYRSKPEAPLPPSGQKFQAYKADKKLCVVRIKNVAGKDPMDFLCAFDVLFNCHNGHDLWDIITAQCQAGRDSKLTLVVDEKSVIDMLGKSTSDIVTIPDPRMSLAIERCDLKVLLDMGQMMSSPSQGAMLRGPVHQLHASYMQDQCVSPCLCYVPMFPYSVRAPFLSFWGMGLSECSGMEVFFHSPHMGDVLPVREERGAKEMLRSQGMWVAKGTTSHSVHKATPVLILTQTIPLEEGAGQTFSHAVPLPAEKTQEKNRFQNASWHARAVGALV